jgi:hypothetical protein
MHAQIVQNHSVKPADDDPISIQMTPASVLFTLSTWLHVVLDARANPS